MSVTKSLAMLTSIAGVSAVVLACGSDERAGAPSATSTSVPPTAAPTIAPTAVGDVAPPTSGVAGGLEVNFIDIELDPDAAPSVFERMLARIPDTEETRKRVNMSDMAAVLELHGFDPLPQDADSEVMIEYVMSFFQDDRDLPKDPVYAWPSSFRDYMTDFSPYPNLAYGLGSISQVATAGEQPAVIEIALGDFNPDATAAALAACDCEQAEIREHAGFSYYGWGDEGGSLRRRLQPPLYDPLGRGGRLLVGDGYAYYATRDSGITQLIDARVGAVPSLADDENLVAAIRWLVALGTVTSMSMTSETFAFDDLATQGCCVDSVRSGDGKSQFTDRTEETVMRALMKGPLLRPFTFAWSGIGYDGARTFTGLVLVHDDAGSARENITRLVQRIREGASVGRLVDGEYTDIPWTDFFSRVDVQAEGGFLVARLYPVESGRTFTLGFSFGDRTLIMHE